MKFCPVCSRVGCRVVAHSFASNAASNTLIKSAEVVPVASNGASNAKPDDRHQRWSRENYNAYQREYMKVYRAVKSGRAEWLRG